MGGPPNSWMVFKHLEMDDETGALPSTNSDGFPLRMDDFGNM